MSKQQADRVTPALALGYPGSQGYSSESLQLYAQAKRNQIGGTGNGIRNLANGVDITTKVYPADIIPDKKAANAKN